MDLLRRLVVITVSGIFLFVSPSRAMTRVFFTSQESVEKELVHLIDKSHSSIDMALFRFASKPLALAIVRARARHVRVRLVLDGHFEAQGKDNHLGIAFVSGEVRRLDGKRGGTQGIMHHKFVIFDKERVVTGSFNWTAGAEHVNYENALLTDSSGVVAAYGREFERLWQRAENVDPGSMDTASPGPQHSSRRSSGKKGARKVKKSRSRLLQ